MIGSLPETLEIDGKEYAIRTDYRVVLVIFQALNDPDLTEEEKAMVMLYSLYKDIPENAQEALNKAVWFMDGGQTYRSNEKRVMVFQALKEKKHPNGCFFCVWWTRGESNSCPKTYSQNLLRGQSMI